MVRLAIFLDVGDPIRQMFDFLLWQFIETPSNNIVITYLSIGMKPCENGKPFSGSEIGTTQQGLWIRNLRDKEQFRVGVTNLG